MNTSREEELARFWYPEGEVIYCISMVLVDETRTGQGTPWFFSMSARVDEQPRHPERWSLFGWDAWVG